MSFEAMALAVKVKVPAKQKIVLLMLADRVNKDTGRCDPSISRLADDCGMSETSVKTALRALRDAGLIVAHERKMGDVHLPNQYELTLDEKSPPGQNTPGGGAKYAPGVGQNTPPNLEDKPVREPDNADADLFGDETSPSQQESQQESLAQKFDEFWESYPPGRKTDKPKAKTAFVAICEGRKKGIPKTEPDLIVAAVRRYAASRPDPQYVPLPTTWLNGARWDQWQHKPARKTSSRDWEEVVR